MEEGRQSNDYSSWALAILIQLAVHSKHFNFWLKQSELFGRGICLQTVLFCNFFGGCGRLQCASTAVWTSTCAFFLRLLWVPWANLRSSTLMKFIKREHS